MVAIKVVDLEHNETTFNVHKSFITHYSPYFDSAFNGTVIEGSTQTLDLIETPIKALGLFVHWIYTQNLDLIDAERCDFEEKMDDVGENKEDEYDSDYDWDEEATTKSYARRSWH